MHGNLSGGPMPIREADEWPTVSDAARGDPFGDLPTPMVLEAAATTGGHRPHNGTDPTGLIRVTVDGQRRVVSVSVGRSWRDHIEPVDMGDALYAAYGSALRSSFDAETASRSRSPSPTLTPGPMAEDRLRAMWSILDSNEVALSEAEAAVIPETRGEWAIRTPGGLLIFHLVGLGLAGIASNERRVAVCDAKRVGADALAGFRAAGLATRAEAGGDEWLE